MRSFRNDDLEHFSAMNADAIVMKFYSAPYSRTHSDGFAKWTQQSLDEDGFGLYAVEEKSTRDLIGYIGFAKAEFPTAFTPAIRHDAEPG